MVPGSGFDGRVPQMSSLGGVSGPRQMVDYPFSFMSI